MNFGGGNTVTTLPLPDGTFNQGDRQWFLDLYADLLVAPPLVVPPFADQDTVLPGIVCGMAVDEAGLCNMALVLVGEEPIQALSENSKPGRFCKQHYENIRDFVLRQNPWNVATTRAALALSATAPTFEFANAFQLPTDFLRLVAIENRRRDFKLEQDKILSDESSMNIVYVFRLIDVSKMDPLLQQTISALLGAELAIPIAQNPDLHRSLLGVYQEKLAEARLQDSMEAPIEVIESRSWVDARTGQNEPWRRITPV